MVGNDVVLECAPPLAIWGLLVTLLFLEGLIVDTPKVIVVKLNML